MKYIWQQKQWPHFEYDVAPLQDLLYTYAREVSYLSGSVDQLPTEWQSEAAIDLMVIEAINTSAIEGEKIDPEEIRSSIRAELGLSKKAPIKDPRAQGIAQLMIEVRKNYKQPLTKEELFKWHTMLMSGSLSYGTPEIGAWHVGIDPMQIVSGPLGREIVHYEAPPSKSLKKEMNQFISWFNDSTSLPGPVRAAIAHLYFECIHPFDDGNGRIGRALVEKILSQDLNAPVLLSLSLTLEKNRKVYYEELSVASKNGLNITRWIDYFVRTVDVALAESKSRVLFILKKATFWKRYADILNPRQTQVLKKMFDAGIEGFKGGINTNKYMKITSCSKATATRDLSELVEYGCLEQLPGSGRSTRYALALKAKREKSPLFF